MDKWKLYKIMFSQLSAYKKENFNNEGFKQRILEVFQNDFFSNSLFEFISKG